MTEAEWLAETDVWRMVFPFPKTKPSGRKFRLFGAACCRRMWQPPLNNRCRNSVEVAERYADGLVGKRILRKAHVSAFSRLSRTISSQLVSGTDFTVDYDRAAWSLTNVDFSELDALDLCKSTLNCISALAVEPPANVLPWSEPAHVAACRRAYDAESEVQCHLLRDIFGNLFRPGKLARTWLTANVAAISQMIYDDRHFSDLPILADALDDAGCHDADILAHCRQPGPHVRGCWVVDAVLGRA